MSNTNILYEHMSIKYNLNYAKITKLNESKLNNGKRKKQKKHKF